MYETTSFLSSYLTHNPILFLLKQPHPLFGKMLRLTDEVPLDSFQLPLRVFASIPHLNLIGIAWIFEGGRLKRRKCIILRAGDSIPKRRICKVIIIEDDPSSVIIDE